MKRAEDGITAGKFEISDFEVDLGDKYAAYVFTLELEARKTGVFTARGLRLVRSGGGELYYHVGNWVFDVGEEGADAGLIDFSGSPAASSNAGEYAYSYAGLSLGAKLTRLWISEDTYVADEAGLPLEGRIPLPDENRPPVTYIRARLVLDTGEGKSVLYDNGCYCGAMAGAGETLAASERHWAEA